MNTASTQDIVIEVLQRASSQNPEVLKPAEAKLREWETQPGFYTALFVSWPEAGKITVSQKDMFSECFVQSFFRHKR
jgi:hypothetical protein